MVVSTWVLAYLPGARQRAFLHLLDEVSTQRDLALVFAEQPDTIPGLPVPPRPDGVPDGRATALVCIQWHDGRRHETRLADLHPHGRWLECVHVARPADAAPDEDDDAALASASGDSAPGGPLR